MSRWPTWTGDQKRQMCVPKQTQRQQIQTWIALMVKFCKEDRRVMNAYAFNIGAVYFMKWRLEKMWGELTQTHSGWETSQSKLGCHFMGKLRSHFHQKLGGTDASCLYYYLSPYWRHWSNAIPSKGLGSLVTSDIIGYLPNQKNWRKILKIMKHL